MNEGMGKKGKETWARRERGTRVKIQKRRDVIKFRKTNEKENAAARKSH